MANYIKIDRDLDDFLRSNRTTVDTYTDYEPEEFADIFDVSFTVVRNSSYFSKYDVKYDEYGDVTSESYVKQIDDSDLEKYKDMVNRLTPQTIANIVSQNYENDGRQDNLSTDELLSKAYTLCADKDYGISPSHMENLSRESDWQNIESWYEGKDIYVSYNDDKISIDMLNTGSESPQNSVKVVIDGRLLDKRAMTLYETPNSPHSAEWVPDEFNTALGYANKVLIENNIKQTPTHENKDIYAVQYGRNNDKVFVYNMEHDSKNLQKVRSMTQSWQNAKVIPLVENGVPTKQAALHVADSLDDSKTQQRLDLSAEQLKALSRNSKTYKSKLTYEVTIAPKDSINYLRADTLKELFPQSETEISSKLLDDYNDKALIDKTRSHSYALNLNSDDFKRFNELVDVVGKDKVGQIIVDRYNQSGWSKTEDVMANLESEASIQTALTTDDFKDFTTNLEL